MKSRTLYFIFILLLSLPAHAAAPVCGQFTDQELKSYRANNKNIEIEAPVPGLPQTNFKVLHARAMDGRPEFAERTKAAKDQLLAFAEQEKKLAPEIRGAFNSYKLFIYNKESHSLHSTSDDDTTITPILYKDRDGKTALAVYNFPYGTRIVSYADPEFAKVINVNNNCQLEAEDSASPINFFKPGASASGIALSEFVCGNKAKIAALAAKIPKTKAAQFKARCDARGGIAQSSPWSGSYRDPDATDANGNELKCVCKNDGHIVSTIPGSSFVAEDLNEPKDWRSWRCEKNKVPNDAEENLLKFLNQGSFAYSAAAYAPLGDKKSPDWDVCKIYKTYRKDFEEYYSSRRAELAQITKSIEFINRATAQFPAPKAVNTLRGNSKTGASPKATDPRVDTEISTKRAN